MLKSDRYRSVYKNINKKIEETYKDKELRIYSFMRLGLFIKYIKSIKAIYKLDINGFYEDAKIILRTVFEVFITIAYCEIDPEERYRRFVDYNVFTISRYYEGDNEIFKLLQVINKKSIEMIELKKKEFKEKYNPKKNFNWNDKSIKKICEELDSYYNSEVYSLMYTSIYMQYSEFIHPNFGNILNNYISINNKKINIHKNIYRDSNNMELIENIEEMNDKLLKINYI